MYSKGDHGARVPKWTPAGVYVFARSGAGPGVGIINK